MPAAFADTLPTLWGALPFDIARCFGVGVEHEAPLAVACAACRRHRDRDHRGPMTPVMSPCECVQVRCSEIVFIKRIPIAG